MFNKQIMIIAKMVKSRIKITVVSLLMIICFSVAAKADQPEAYDILPDEPVAAVDPDVAYKYYKSNEKIDGIQTATTLNCEVIPTGDQITWIGDSYTIIGYSSIMKYFQGADIYAQTGKAADYDYYYGSNPSGIDILASLANNGRVRPYLVFALGTNISVGSMGNVVDRVMKLAGPDTKVVFVTARTLYETRTTQNNQLKTAAAKYDNAVVADWAAVCQPWYFGDEAHLNSYDLWVATIYQALLADY